MAAHGQAERGSRRQCSQLVSILVVSILCLARITLAARFAPKASLLGSLSAVQGRDDCVPYEVHLAVSDNNGDIRATWRTPGLGCPSTVSYGRADRVEEGTLGKPRRLQSDGSSYTISEELMCDAPAKKKPFTVVMHTAVMSYLEPNAMYWYSLGGSDASWTFRAPPPLGSDEPFSFIAFGDMGESNYKARKNYKAAETVKAIKAEMDSRPVGMIVHVGDLAYADGKYKVWDSFMTQIEPLSSIVPYMVGIGNHEAGPCSSGADNDPSGERPYEPDWGNYGPESGGECGAMTAHRFIMPGGADLESRGRGFAAAAASGGGASAAANASAAAQGVQRRALAAALKTSGTSALVGATSVEAATAADASDRRQEDAAGQGVGDGAAAEPDVDAGKAASLGRITYRQQHDNPPFWYSFEYGTVHFTMLSSEHNLEDGSKQRQWLEVDLEGVDRCRTPWVIVGIHRPMYVVYPHKDNRVVGDHIRASIEDILLEHQVDLVVSGHVHTYYRSCSAAGGKCVDDEREGIVHVTIGTAGHELSTVEDDQKDWCDQVIHDWGFGRFDVDGDELNFSFIRSEDGRVADSLKLRAKVVPGEACRGGGSSGRQRRATSQTSAI